MRRGVREDSTRQPATRPRARPPALTARRARRHDGEHTHPPAAHPTCTAPAPETAETAPSNCERDTVTTGPSAAADAHAPARAAHEAATAPTAGMHTRAGETNTAPTARTLGHAATKRGPPTGPTMAQKQPRFRRWHFQTPKDSITVT